MNTRLLVEVEPLEKGGQTYQCRVQLMTTD